MDPLVGEGLGSLLRVVATKETMTSIAMLVLLESLSLDPVVVSSRPSLTVQTVKMLMITFFLS